jgi:hypothetical protein
VQSLESYLASEYFKDQQDIAALTGHLAIVGATLAHLKQDLGWAYDASGSPVTEISCGTVAMIVTSLGRMLGTAPLPGGTRQSLVKDEKISQAFEAGLALLAGVNKGGQPVDTAAKELTSRTFGTDNPLTLSHIVELLAIVDQDGRTAQLSGIRKLVDPAKAKLDRLLADGEIGTKSFITPEGASYHINAFVPLRALQAARKLEIPFEAPRMRPFFEALLHDQLSFSAIPDSRFDPAELIFCLEGLLLCAPHAVDTTLFKRVIDVLAEKQNTSSHWRPNKPFIGWRTGAIMLPLSVEAANSLMRSVAQMDGHRYYDTHTAQVLPLMRRFWRWLQARAVNIVSEDITLLGWHSEHVNQPDVIHTWDTSQVAEFMMGYADLLDRHVAAQTLRLSRLSVKDPLSPGRLTKTKTNAAKDKWKALAEKYEPSPGNKQNVYGSIGQHVVDGWAEGAPTSFSMLLYGPPGTGKTTVADALSDALGMRLITVTVSDFLGAGGENVETRAKAIFQTLEAQREAVILFDEIDSFLLDRDSKFYRKQDSLFQFLTPGMLTKLADLRKRERSIFIIATNYENRIDAAIKRTGRIDQRYLLPLPNAAKRIQILEELGLNVSRDQAALLTASVLKGYGDMKAAVKGAKMLDGKPDAADVVALLQRAKPATSIASYAARLKESPYPWDELAGLVALVEEIDNPVAIEKHLSALSPEVKRLAKENTNE